jgi:hypothetical protein
MIPATLQLIIAMIAFAINERMQRKLGQANAGCARWAPAGAPDAIRVSPCQRPSSSRETA